MKYLILGNGAAGTEAALAIRKNDPEGTIEILTESAYLHYYRPKLVHFLADDHDDPSALVVYNEEFYHRERIVNILGRKAVSIDPDKKIVADQYGDTYSYDKLLIATGSKPFVPPIPGIDLEGVFTLRSITDAKKLRSFSAQASNILVIGGGLLGLENAFSLSQLGKKVTVVEFAGHLLPRQLDQDGGRHLQKLLEAKGLEFILSEQVEKITGKDKVESVVLKSGKSISCQAVLVSAGIRGDLDFLKGTRLNINRGIVVDDNLKTSFPDVWAAGDVAEHRGLSYGLWTVAREQGKIAGLNMAGIPTAYEGSLPSSLLKITGISVFSAGEQTSTTGEVMAAQDDETYKKLVLSDGKARGAMVVGDRTAIATIQKILSGKAQPEEFKKHLEV